ncbi:MAG: GDSL-type esterase/lipase family protein [Candidatus Binatia bacterium]
MARRRADGSVLSAPHEGRRRGVLLVAAAGAVLATLVVLELVLRATVVPFRLPAPPAPRTLDPYAENPFVVRARPLLQTFVPGSRYRAARAGYDVEYAINAHGFRGPEVGDKHRPRLLLVGDSIAEGHGVPFESALPSLLGKALDGDGWDVVNAAMQGGSPIHYAANVERYLALEPDAVVLLLYENDLWDDRAREAAYADLPLLDDDVPLQLLVVAKRAWRNLSPTPLEQRILANRDLAPEQPVDARFPWVLSEAEVDRQFRASAPYLDVFATALAARDVPLVVAFVAIGALVPEGQPLFGEHARALEDDVGEWAVARGAPFLSLCPLVMQAFASPGGGDVMIAGDGHPTIGMQRRLADAMAPWLRANLPVPKHG